MPNVLKHQTGHSPYNYFTDLYRMPAAHCPNRITYNYIIYIYNICVCGPSEETLSLYLRRGAELFDATLSNEAMHQRGKGGLLNHLYLLHGHGLRVETSFSSVFLFSASCWFTIMTGNILLHCGTTCVLFC